MKKAILFLFVSASAFALQAQSLSPTVISSGGNYVTAGNVSLSYTVGQPSAINTVTSSDNLHILTQGFQQPNDIINGLLDVEKEGDAAFSIYPNPAKDNLWFGYEFSQSGKAEVSVINIIGQKLDFNLSEVYDNGKVIHHLDCSSYAAGHYIMSVKFTNTAGQEKVMSKKFQIIN